MYFLNEGCIKTLVALLTRLNVGEFYWHSLVWVRSKHTA